MSALADRKTDRKVLLAFTRTLFPKFDSAVRAVIKFWDSDVGKWKTGSQEQVNKGRDVRLLTTRLVSSCPSSADDEMGPGRLT